MVAQQSSIRVSECFFSMINKILVPEGAWKRVVLERQSQQLWTPSTVGLKVLTILQAHAAQSQGR